MTLGSFSNALKGIGGEYEITRVVGFAGGVSYILGVHIFIAWNMIEGREFDVTAYCIAFPSGFAAILAAIAGAASLKDRNVAVAKDTEAKTKAIIGEGSAAIDQAADDAAHAVAEAATDERDNIQRR